MLFGEDLFLEGALMSWGTCSWNHYEAEAYTFLDSFFKTQEDCLHRQTAGSAAGEAKCGDELPESEHQGSGAGLG